MSHEEAEYGDEEEKDCLFTFCEFNVGVGDNLLILKNLVYQCAEH